jgi:hypothetical protein
LTKQLGPFLSDKRGKIAFDNRTSSLIITDTDEIINRIAKLVKSLDVPPLQVMIEGKIVEATEEFQRSVGVNWSFDGEKVNLSPSGGANGGPLDLRAGLSINPISRASLLGNPLALDLTVGRLDFLGEREDKGDRMAATIRHNRARGEHKVDSMAEIVIELKRRFWSDEKIAKELGMEADEVLRLQQVTGLAALFSDREFSTAWEATSFDEVDGVRCELA